MIYLPPYSPNLNHIERLWKFMRKKVINTTYYAEFNKFRQAVLGFFESIDQHKVELKQFIGDKFHLLNPDPEPKTTLA
jgi:transposase